MTERLLSRLDALLPPDELINRAWILADRAEKTLLGFDEFVKAEGNAFLHYGLDKVEFIRNEGEFEVSRREGRLVVERMTKGKDDEEIYETLTLSSDSDKPRIEFELEKAKGFDIPRRERMFRDTPTAISAAKYFIRSW